jgi:hypothetical protein
VAGLRLTWRLRRRDLYSRELTLLVAQTCVRHHRSTPKSAAARASCALRGRGVTLRHAHIVLVAATGRALGRLMKPACRSPAASSCAPPSTRTRRQVRPGHESDLDAPRVGGAGGVRSSGLNEDGTDKSYAGVFESVSTCERSLFEALGASRTRGLAWRVSDAARRRDRRAGMVPAAWAGVLFTEHPGDPRGRSRMIPVSATTWCRGARTAASGSTLTGRVLGPDAARRRALYAWPRVETVRQAAGHRMGFAGGRFQLLQARHHAACRTARKTNALARGERAPSRS